MDRTVPASLHQPDPPLLARVRCVLMGTQHPGNLGATARALKTMGVSDLWLVAPLQPDLAAHPEARARASGATDILDRAQVVSHLEQALTEVSWAVAVSAEPREFGPVPQIPEAMASQACALLQAQAGHRVALVFGPERTGLSMAAVQACHALVSIPASPVYASLNLAQAVMILMYTMRGAALRAQAAPAPARTALLADHGAMQGLFAHMERALIAIGFLDPSHPKKLLPRMRRWLLRSRLQREEVDWLRGVCKQMEHSARAGGPSSGRDAAC